MTFTNSNTAMAVTSTTHVHLSAWRSRRKRKRPWPPFSLLATLLSLFLVVSLTSSLAKAAGLMEDEVNLCSGNSILRTKYFVPFYEKERPAEIACASKELTATSKINDDLEIEAGFEVHVVRVNTTERDVMLTVNGKITKSELTDRKLDFDFVNKSWKL